MVGGSLDVELPVSPDDGLDPFTSARIDKELAQPASRIETENGRRNFMVTMMYVGAAVTEVLWII